MSDQSQGLCTLPGYVKRWSLCCGWHSAFQEHGPSWQLSHITDSHWAVCTEQQGETRGIQENFSNSFVIIQTNCNVQFKKEGEGSCDHHWTLSVSRKFNVKKLLNLARMKIPVLCRTLWQRFIPCCYEGICFGKLLWLGLVVFILRKMY